MPNNTQILLLITSWHLKQYLIVIYVWNRCLHFCIFITLIDKSYFESVNGVPAFLTDMLIRTLSLFELGMMCLVPQMRMIFLYR